MIVVSTAARSGFSAPRGQEDDGVHHDAEAHAEQPHERAAVKLPQHRRQEQRQRRELDAAHDGGEGIDTLDVFPVKLLPHLVRDLREQQPLDFRCKIAHVFFSHSRFRPPSGRRYCPSAGRRPQSGFE